MVTSFGVLHEQDSNGNAKQGTPPRLVGINEACKFPGRCTPTIFLRHFWGSLFGIPVFVRLYIGRQHFQNKQGFSAGLGAEDLESRSGLRSRVWRVESLGFRVYGFGFGGRYPACKIALKPMGATFYMDSRLDGPTRVVSGQFRINRFFWVAVPRTTLHNKPPSFFVDTDNPA